MNVFVAIIKLAAIFAMLFIASEMYTFFRKKATILKIGGGAPLRLLRRGDYVLLNGKIYRFSHIARANETINILSIPSEANKTSGGELAFENDRGLGYLYYPSSAMNRCDFISGKYGLKWAADKITASNARNLINKHLHIDE